MKTLSVWVERLTAPKQFDDLRLEEEFRREYHAEGRIVTIYGFMLGATLALVSFILIELQVVPASGNEWMQRLRLAAVATMVIAVLVMIWTKDLALRQHCNIVGCVHLCSIDHFAFRVPQKK